MVKCLLARNRKREQDLQCLAWTPIIHISTTIKQASTIKLTHCYVAHTKREKTGEHKKTSQDYGRPRSHTGNTFLPCPFTETKLLAHLFSPWLMSDPFTRAWGILQEKWFIYFMPLLLFPSEPFVIETLWFCSRVPVHRNRYKRPNNVQQLNKGSWRKEYNGYSLCVPVCQDTTTLWIQNSFLNPILSHHDAHRILWKKIATGSFHRDGDLKVLWSNFSPWFFRLIA